MYEVTIIDNGKELKRYCDDLAENEADAREHGRKVASVLGASVFATIKVTYETAKVAVFVDPRGAP